MPVPTSEILLFGVLLNTVIFAFFCFTLYRAMLQVRISNRKMKAELVWLLLIPGFQLIWNFVVVSALANSLKLELSDRDFEINEKPGFAIGIAYSVVSCLVSVPFFPLTVLGFLSLAVIILLIQYWSKINWYRKVLENDSKNPETIGE